MMMNMNMNEVYHLLAVARVKGEPYYKSVYSGIWCPNVSGRNLILTLAILSSYRYHPPISLRSTR